MHGKKPSVEVFGWLLVERAIASWRLSAPVPSTGWLTFSMKLFTLLRRPARLLAES
jgi:hypothetical protein